MMDPVDDLVVWLRRQLDRDAAMARNAFGPHNDAVASWSELWSGVVQLGPEEDLVNTADDSQIARFIAEHDPARVLAEVDAKRKIIEGAEYFMWDADGAGPDPIATLTLRLLALPYSHRPGYQEAWRP